MLMVSFHKLGPHQDRVSPKLSPTTLYEGVLIQGIPEAALVTELKYQPHLCTWGVSQCMQYKDSRMKQMPQAWLCMHAQWLVDGGHRRMHACNKGCSSQYSLSHARAHHSMTLISHAYPLDMHLTQPTCSSPHHTSQISLTNACPPNQHLNTYLIGVHHGSFRAVTGGPCRLL